MKALIQKMTNKESQGYAEAGTKFFKDLPHLPKTWIDFIVKITPVLTLIGAVLSILAFLPILGLLGILSAFTFNSFLVGSVLVSSLFALATGVIMFMAYKPLKAHSYDGWMLLFWSEVLWAVESLIRIVAMRDTVGAIIGTLIGFYILYEIRPRYKN